MAIEQKKKKTTEKKEGIKNSKDRRTSTKEKIWPPSRKAKNSQTWAKRKGIKKKKKLATRGKRSRGKGKKPPESTHCFESGQIKKKGTDLSQQRKGGGKTRGKRGSGGEYAILRKPKEKDETRKRAPTSDFTWERVWAAANEAAKRSKKGKADQRGNWKKKAQKRTNRHEGRWATGKPLNQFCWVKKIQTGVRSRWFPKTVQKEGRGGGGEEGEKKKSEVAPIHRREGKKRKKDRQATCGRAKKTRSIFLRGGKGNVTADFLPRRNVRLRGVHFGKNLDWEKEGKTNCPEPEKKGNATLSRGGGEKWEESKKTKKEWTKGGRDNRRLKKQTRHKQRNPKNVPKESKVP